MSNQPDHLTTSTEEDETIDSVNPTRWPIAWLLIVLLAAGFAFMKFNGTYVSSEPVAEIAEPDFPHFYLTEVEVKQYSDKGELRYQMTSPMARHFGQLNDKASLSRFTTPTFLFQDNPQAPLWQVTADEGRRELNGLWFTLSGHVLAQKPADAQGDFVLLTDELRLNTLEQFAETNKAVTMRSLQGDKRSETQAQGAKADFKQNVVDLLSDVKGYHEP